MEKYDLLVLGSGPAGQRAPILSAVCLFAGHNCT